MDVVEPASRRSGPFRVPPDVSWRDAPVEIILFDARTDAYHVLNDAAAQAWRLLAEGACVHAAVAALCEQFDADPAEIEADVAALVLDLVERDLLRPEPAP
jgi:hypothetical protein